MLQSQTGLPLFAIGTMAEETVVRENRPHVPIEIDQLGSVLSGKRVGRQQAPTTDPRDCDDKRKLRGIATFEKHRVRTIACWNGGKNSHKNMRQPRRRRSTNIMETPLVPYKRSAHGSRAFPFFKLGKMYATLARRASEEFPSQVGRNKSAQIR